MAEANRKVMDANHPLQVELWRTVLLLSRAELCKMLYLDYADTSAWEHLVNIHALYKGYLERVEKQLGTIEVNDFHAEATGRLNKYRACFEGIFYTIIPNPRTFESRQEFNDAANVAGSVDNLIAAFDSLVPALADE